MVTISDFLSRLDASVPLERAAEWDEVGLQVGDGSAQASLVGVCHEVSQSVVDAAANASVDLLVSYHPLLFRPTTRFVAGSSAPGRAFALARIGCGLISVHTAFDVETGGTADALASAVGIEFPVGFEAAEDSGLIGRIGSVAQTTLAEFADLVGGALKSPVLRRSGNDSRLVRRVAVVPGSGSEFMSAAAEGGADVLVTGDVSHHRAVRALELGLAVIDAGHTATERPGMDALVERLGTFGVDVLDLTSIRTDPWEDGTSSLTGRTLQEGE